jgi:acylphosphatase
MTHAADPVESYSSAVRRRLVISGRVQGVGYRAWLGRKARTAGLVGEVRNRDDGCVEAILQGPLESIDQVIRRCRSGPLLARVSNLETTEESPQPCSVFRMIE